MNHDYKIVTTLTQRTLNEPALQIDIKKHCVTKDLPHGGSIVLK